MTLRHLFLIVMMPLAWSAACNQSSRSSLESSNRLANTREKKPTEMAELLVNLIVEENFRSILTEISDRELHRLLDQLNQNCRLDVQVFVREDVPQIYDSTTYAIDIRVRRKDQPRHDISHLGLLSIARLSLPDRTQTRDLVSPDRVMSGKIQQIQSSIRLFVQKVVRENPGCSQTPDSTSTES